MRCRSCNKNLNDYESTCKYEDGVYVDMCATCFRESGYRNIVRDRKDLKGKVEFISGEFDEDKDF